MFFRHPMEVLEMSPFLLLFLLLPELILETPFREGKAHSGKEKHQTLDLIVLTNNFPSKILFLEMLLFAYEKSLVA